MKLDKENIPEIWVKFSDSNHKLNRYFLLQCRQLVSSLTNPQQNLIDAFIWKGVFYRYYLEILLHTVCIL